MSEHTSNRASRSTAPRRLCTPSGQLVGSVPLWSAAHRPLLCRNTSAAKRSISYAHCIRIVCSTFQKKYCSQSWQMWVFEEAQPGADQKKTRRGHSAFAPRMLRTRKRSHRHFRSFTRPRFPTHSLFFLLLTGFLSKLRPPDRATSSQRGNDRWLSLCLVLFPSLASSPDGTHEKPQLELNIHI